RRTSRRRRRRAACRRSVDRQVALQLPVVDLRDVLVPLEALRRDELRVGVFAERLTHQRIALERVDRLLQVAGEARDLEARALAGAHRVDVLVDRRGRLEFALDAVEARSQDTGEG